MVCKKAPSGIAKKTSRENLEEISKYFMSQFFFHFPPLAPSEVRMQPRTAAAV
jgi:hypothetical protein